MTQQSFSVTNQTFHQQIQEAQMKQNKLEVIGKYFLLL